MALRANDADCYKSWLALGIEQLGRDVAGEVESDWMVPLLVEEERQADCLAAGCEHLNSLSDNKPLINSSVGSYEMVSGNKHRFLHGFLSERHLIAKTVAKQLVALLSIGAILLQTGCGRTKIAAFESKDAAAKACFEYMDKEIKSEINKTTALKKGNEYDFDNWTAIKNDDERYLIFDYTCKPSFSKGDTVGELIPIYFYLNEDGEVEGNRMMRWKEKFIEYTYPLGKRIDFDSPGVPNDESKMSWFVKPYKMLFTSIKSDAFIAGVGFGSILRLCRSTYSERDITEEQAEKLFQKDREYINKMANNKEGYAPIWGPTSNKAKDEALRVMDARWKNCKKNGYEGWD